MGKDFLKSTVDSKRITTIILIAGLFITTLLGAKAYKETELVNGNELYRGNAIEGEYDQELIAYLGEQKVPVTVTVEERILSKEEADKEFLKAEEILPDILKGENESLSSITTDMVFADKVPGTFVEVEWTERQSNFFYSDGRLRENLILKEPVKLQLSAILICQEHTKDYNFIVAIMPRELEIEQKLLNHIYQENVDKKRTDIMTLPKEYEGEHLTWRKPLDVTFIYFFVLTVGAVLFLKFGEEKNKKEALKERKENLEKDYAQIVGKFTMLLSAGLSIRNAWERIVLMQQKKGTMERVIYQELNWGLLQMQKGISELEVYEKFGDKVCEVHYKKLMALFISDKRRGSIPLLEAMNQEMLAAWEEQKRKTKQQGEKIGTKLLIPMMGMLGVVFMIIMVPALLSF